MGDPKKKRSKQDESFYRPIFSYEPIGTHSCVFSIELPFPIPEGPIGEKVLDLFEKKGCEFAEELEELANETF